MSRTYVVTGSASGIGKATVGLLRDRGHSVIGVDLHDAEIITDLTTVDGRLRLVDEARRLSHGSVDGVLAIAGVQSMQPVTVAMNYFGSIATLEGLRPLLAESEAPRAVAVTSVVSLFPVDEKLVELMTFGDEAAALAHAANISVPNPVDDLLYPSTKRALAQWIRRTAPTSEWAGTGISLNAIAPGIVNTPMSAPALATADARAVIDANVPAPLNGFSEPIAPARLLAGVASEENTHLCGQVIFIDGGGDALMRGDSTW